MSGSDRPSDRSSSSNRPSSHGGKPRGSGNASNRGGKGRPNTPGRPGGSDRPPRTQRTAPPRKPTDRPESGRDEFRDELGDIDVRVLPRDVIADLEILSPGTRARVERWLAATRLSLEDDPQQAYEYAKEAGRIGGRSSVVREAVGIAAYHAGEFAAARKELQAARRIGGRDDLIPLLADCERALGNPRKAVDLANSPEAKALRGEPQAELLLVASGARLDLGQTNAAISLLRGPCSNTPANAAWAARIYYGYAEALLAERDVELARDWFVRAAGADMHAETDASDRIAELDSGE